MIIYFRCTSKKETVSGVERWVECSKDEMVLKCWMSLQLAAVPKDDSFVVLHDELHPDSLQFLKESCTCSTNFIEIEPHNIQDRAHTFKLISVLEEKLKEDEDNKIHYIVEDDYLHTRDSLSKCKEIFKFWEHFVIPYDYPDRYTIDKNPCGVIVGPSCHWRTNPSATYTLMAKRDTWNSALSTIRKHAPHNFTEEAFTQHPCISPIPGVATHLTKYHMSPVVDWNQVGNRL